MSAGIGRGKITEQERKDKESAYQKVYRQANKTKIDAYQRDWRQKNKAKRAAYYKANKERIAEYSKAHRQANKERLAEYRKAHRQANRKKGAANRRAYYQADKGKRTADQNEYQRAYRLKFKFGISIEQYNTKLDGQGFACAICEAPELSVCNRRLAVDHCHKTGTIRSLLCTHCNTLLGLARDSPEFLERAAKYLRQHGIGGM